MHHLSSSLSSTCTSRRESRSPAFLFRAACKSAYRQTGSYACYDDGWSCCRPHGRDQEEWLCVRPNCLVVSCNHVQLVIIRDVTLTTIAISLIPSQFHALRLFNSRRDRDNGYIFIPMDLFSWRRIRLSISEMCKCTLMTLLLKSAFAKLNIEILAKHTIHIYLYSKILNMIN